MQGPVVAALVATAIVAMQMGRSQFYAKHRIKVLTGGAHSPPLCAHYFYDVTLRYVISGLSRQKGGGLRGSCTFSGVRLLRTTIFAFNMAGAGPTQPLTCAALCIDSGAFLLATQTFSSKVSCSVIFCWISWITTRSAAILGSSDEDACCKPAMSSSLVLNAHARFRLCLVKLQKLHGMAQILRDGSSVLCSIS